MTVLVCVVVMVAVSEIVRGTTMVEVEVVVKVSVDCSDESVDVTIAVEVAVAVLPIAIWVTCLMGRLVTVQPRTVVVIVCVARGNRLT